jgi:hypothetical protein
MPHDLQIPVNKTHLLTSHSLVRCTCCWVIDGWALIQEYTSMWKTTLIPRAVWFPGRATMCSCLAGRTNRTTLYLNSYYYSLSASEVYSAISLIYSPFQNPSPIRYASIKGWRWLHG